MLRGIINPLSDRMLEHDPALRELILELERQAIALPDQSVDSPPV